MNHHFEKLRNWPGARKSLRAFFIFSCFVFTCFTAQGQVATDSVFSADNLVEDLQLLKMRVLETHQNPYTYCTEEQLDSAFAAAHDSVLQGGTFLEFAGIVASTLRVIHDSHTYLNYSMLGKNYKREDGLFLNFSVMSLDNGSIIVTDDGQDVIPPGSQLFTINGHNVYDLYDQTQRYTIQEGNSERGSRRITDAIFPSLVSMLIEVDSVNTVEFKDIGEPLPSRKKYPGKTYEKLKNENKSRWKVIPDNKKNNTLDLKIHEEDSLAVLKIKSFAKGKSGKYYRFLRRSFRKIRKSDVKYLAVDLRDNTGGQTNRMEAIFNYISEEEFTVPRVIIARQSEISKAHYQNQSNKFQRFLLKLFFANSEKATNYLKIMEMPVGEVDTLYYSDANSRSKRNFFDGEVFLFLNGRSGSASVNFAGCFQEYELGLIIGEPCLGPACGTWGNPAPYEMKNSKLNIYISTIRSITTKDLEVNPEPIKPDFYVPYNADDFLFEEDTQLNFLKELLEEGRK